MWGWRWGTDPKGFASLSDTAPPANTAPPTLGRDLGPLAVLLMKGCTAATASEAHNRAMGVTDTLLALIPAGKSAAWPERNHTEHPEPPRALGGPVLIPTTPIPIAVRAGARWGHWDGGWGMLQGGSLCPPSSSAGPPELLVPLTALCPWLWAGQDLLSTGRVAARPIHCFPPDPVRADPSLTLSPMLPGGEDSPTPAVRGHSQGNLGAESTRFGGDFGCHQQSCCATKVRPRCHRGEWQ